MFPAIVALLVLAYFFHLFFIRGIAWPIILVVLGFIGGRLTLLTYFPSSAKTIGTFLTLEISYASFLSLILIILGVEYILRAAESE